MSLMRLFFDKKNPKTELEGLEKAQQILDERYKMHQVSDELYRKQCLEFQKKREKYLKKIK